MCGYFGNLHESPAVLDLMNQLNIPLPYPVQRAYNRKSFDGLVTANDEGYSVDPATWWYSHKKEDGKWVPNYDLTTFNARNLDGRMWKSSVRKKRGLVFATEIGESLGKERFLMKSSEGFALGCLYNDWVNDDGSVKTSFAVITRDPHERFSKYHDKSIPLFLPIDKAAIEEWLDPSIETSPIVEEILNNPLLRVDLEVTKVKSYKNAEVLAETELLKKD